MPCHDPPQCYEGGCGRGWCVLGDEEDRIGIDMINKDCEIYLSILRLFLA